MNAPVPDDVRRLVIAARVVAYGDATPDPESMAELDKAAESFADRVPWTGEMEGRS